MLGYIAAHQWSTATITTGVLYRNKSCFSQTSHKISVQSWFSLRLTVMMSFKCMLLCPPDSVHRGALRLITGDSSLTQHCVFYENVGCDPKIEESSTACCLFSRCCKDCLLTSAPWMTLNTVVTMSGHLNVICIRRYKHLQTYKLRVKW